MQQRHFIAILLTFLITAFFSDSRIAYAASTSFDTNTITTTTGEVIHITALIDSNNELVNAVEGLVAFPAHLFELRSVLDGDSIVNFWIDKPKLKAPGVMHFSGIVPGGFNDHKATLFTLELQAINTGSGTVALQDIILLKNDGTGSSISTTTTPAHATVEQSTGEARQKAEIIADNTPPEAFTPALMRDESIVNGQWFAVFGTQDKKSGVASYQVSERKQYSVWPLRWRSAESPFLLRDQKLESVVRIKAIDRSGNERVAMLQPVNPRPWYRHPLLYGILMLISLGVIVVRRRYARK